MPADTVTDLVSASPYRVPPTGLTAPQQEFVRVYLVTGSAHAAYVRAFAPLTQADRANARTYAYRLLKTAEVK